MKDLVEYVNHNYHGCGHLENHHDHLYYVWQEKTLGGNTITMQCIVETIGFSVECHRLPNDLRKLIEHFLSHSIIID